MLAAVIDAFIAALEDSAASFSQVEIYEGQFERDEISKLVIKPPCAFVEIVGATQQDGAMNVADETVVRVWLASDHIRGRGSVPGILQLIDTMLAEIHSKVLKTGSLKILATLTDYRSEGYLGNMAIYTVDFNVKRC